MNAIGSALLASVFFFAALPAHSSILSFQLSGTVRTADAQLRSLYGSGDVLTGAFELDSSAGWTLDNSGRRYMDTFSGVLALKSGHVTFRDGMAQIVDPSQGMPGVLSLVAGSWWSGAVDGAGTVEGLTILGVNLQLWLPALEGGSGLSDVANHLNDAGASGWLAVSYNQGEGPLAYMFADLDSLSLADAARVGEPSSFSLMLFDGLLLLLWQQQRLPEWRSARVLLAPRRRHRLCTRRCVDAA